MADPRIFFLGLLRKQVQQLNTDLIREMFKLAAEYLMGLDADPLCGAGRGQKSKNRINNRNGYQNHLWDTLTGTINLAIPRPRKGSNFPGF